MDVKSDKKNYKFKHRI